MTEVTTTQKVQPPTYDQYGTQTSPGGYGAAASSESGLSLGETSGTVNGQYVERPKDVPVNLSYTPERVVGGLRGGHGIRYQSETEMRTGKVLSESFTDSRYIPGVLTARQDLLQQRPDLHIAPQPGQYGYHATPGNPGGIAGSTPWNMPTYINPETGKGYAVPDKSYPVERYTLYPAYEKAKALSERAQDYVNRRIEYDESASIPVKVMSGASSFFTGIPEFAGTLAIGAEAVIREPLKAPARSITGIEMQAIDFIESAKSRPAETVGFVGAMVLAPRVAKVIDRGATVVKSELPAVSRDIVSGTKEMMRDTSAELAPTKLKPKEISKLPITKEFSDYLNSQSEARKKSTGPISVPGSPFSKDPVLPGQRLLGSNSGLGNRPIMPYERMASEFLPQSTDRTFITPGKQTFTGGVVKRRPTDLIQALNADAGIVEHPAEPSFIIGKTLKRTSRGTAFEELNKRWDERTASNERQSGQRTAQGQIVLTKQKQIQEQISKQVQQQRAIQKSRTKSLDKLLYVSAAERMQSAQSQFQVQKQVTSLTHKEITGQITGQRQSQSQMLKSMQGSKQAIKQLTGQSQVLRSMQSSKNIQILRTSQLLDQVQNRKLKFPVVSNKIVSLKAIRKSIRSRTGRIVRNPIPDAFKL